MADNGNSNRISRAYLDSLLIEPRYLDAEMPDPGFTLFGQHFSSPIMTAALSHLDHFMFSGASELLAQGAKDADAVLWYGAAEEEEIERLAAICPHMIEIIKPYADRSLIYEKIAHAEKCGLLAVGIDIDHAFTKDGSIDEIHGHPLAPLRTGELAEICKSTSLPVIMKGVLSLRDGEKCLSAGAGGIVLSHHNNRIEYAVPPMAVLPEFVKLIAGAVPLFVDCEIQTGMDAFKALALGATGVCIGRPLMTAIKKDGAKGVGDYLKQAVGELKQAMAYTGCSDLGRMDASVIRRI